MSVTQFNEETKQWDEILPLPFYWGLLPFLWKRITGWKDQYGRKAYLISWKEFF